jgi:hypothetical protein
VKTNSVQSHSRQIRTSAQFRPVLHGALLVTALIAIIGSAFLIHALTHKTVPARRGALPIQKPLVHSSVKPKDEAKPMPLDFSGCPPGLQSKANGVFRSLLGTHEFDGLPFEVSGEFVFTRRGETNHVPLLDKIPIGRRFDELHLLDLARWQTAPGVTIAIVRLNYEDGTKYEFPIQYAVHVLDWYRLPSEEQEVITDPDTKICWRHTPVNFGASVRVFKSVLMNPHPSKVVSSMDVVSTQSESSYVLLAATVAKTDYSRQSTPTPPDSTGNIRHFDGKLAVHVVDATGQPVEGAWLVPGMQVNDFGVIAPIVLTSKTGDGTIPYPTDRTKYVGVMVRKNGYKIVSGRWAAGHIPDSITNQLDKY